MGYQIRTLSNLPTSFNCYYFLIGDYRNSAPINTFFNTDFSVISDRIGPTKAIIKSTRTNSLEHELEHAISKVMTGKSNLSSFLRACETRQPGLLITQEHPAVLTDSSKAIFIPFQDLEDVYTSSNALISDMEAFSFANENNELIKKVNSKHKFKTEIGVSLNLGPVSFNVSHEI